MKRIPIIILLINCLVYTQSVNIKDNGDNTLIQVTDEGTTGAIMFPSGGTPAPTTNKLYNEGGTLKWNGSELSTSGGDNLGNHTATANLSMAGFGIDLQGGYLGYSGSEGGGVLHITSAGNFGIGTLSPSAKLHVIGLDGLLVQGTFGDGILQNLGASTRMHFYPKKAAFRAGNVDGTQWNDENIGNYSVAMGQNTKASGDQSTAMGYVTEASGTHSTTMGCYTIASNLYSTAIGYSTTASGERSTSLGSFTTADSYASVSLGQYNVGGGNASGWIYTDPLFEIGIGLSDVAKDNAMTVLKNGNVGIGTTSPISKLSVGGNGQADAAVYGESSVPFGYGVYGEATLTGTTTNYGGYFLAEGYSGYGVQGVASHDTGVNFGVYGETSSDNGWAGYFSGRGYFSSKVGIGTVTPARNLHVNDVIRLEPRATAPTSPAAGDMYIDSSDHNILKVYDGTEWQACWGPT
jgi:hypothetical protein